MRCSALLSSVPGLLLILSSSGCQILTDVDAQCGQSADCEQLFGPGHVCGGDGVCSPVVTASGAVRAAIPPRWACLERSAPLIEVDSGRSVQVRIGVYDYAKGDPLEGIRIRACAPDDRSCNQPIVDGITTDDDGMVEFEVPHGFDGDFELAGDDRPPLILSGTPRVEDSSMQALMPTTRTLTENAALGGDRYDETRGFVLLALFDCYGQPADGVRLDALSAPDNAAFYFDGSIPTRDLHSTRINHRRQPPESLAIGGFINVMPGSATFRGTLDEGGYHMGYITVQVRSGTVTVAHFQAGYE
jgi:hypothetical protein